MNKEDIKIIEEFVNSDNFVIIEDYISKPYIETLEELDQENQQLKEKNKYLIEKIENKNRWCQLIVDLGYDYDGYNDVDNLKLLIDELVKYALLCRDDYDYEEFFKDSDVNA